MKCWISLAFFVLSFSIRAENAPLILREFAAADRSFTGKIPTDWTINAASLRYFQATSPLKESVSVITLDVSIDQHSMETYAEVQRYSGNPLPPQMQFYSQPLSPVDVVRVLYPHIAQGSVSNLQILNARSVPVQQGMQAATIYYQYQSPNLGSMQGESLIITLPPTYTGAINYWTLIAAGGEAPFEIFQRNKALYPFIFGNLQYNKQILQENARLPFDRMWQNDPEYQKNISNLLSVLGAGYPYEDPQGNRFDVPIPPPPTKNTLWYCGGNTTYIRSVQPNPTCVPLRPSIK